MATQNQVLADRENARHSTGPKTEQGKANSARNSLRHGLASGRLIICGESREEYERLHAGLVADHQPANNTESMLVAQMAESRWLMERALHLQQKAFDSEDTLPKDLAILLRYYSTYERSFHKALAALTKLQNEKKKAEIRFVSQKQREEDRQRAEKSRNLREKLHLAREAAKINRERIMQYVDGPMPGQPGWQGEQPPDLIKPLDLAA